MSSLRFTLMASLSTALVATSVLGCDKKSDAPSSEAAPAATTAAAPAADKVATPPTTAAKAVPAAAAPSAQTADLKSMFAGPAEAGTKDSETIVATGGVVLGFPSKWTSGNIYDAETAFNSPVISPTVRGADIMCEVEDKFDKSTLHGRTYADQIQKEKWSEEVDGTVGVDGYPAKLGKGTGEQVGAKHEPVTVYYVHTNIPGAKGVSCVAAFPTSHPELEKDVITSFKGMRSSKAKK